MTPDCGLFGADKILDTSYFQVDTIKNPMNKLLPFAVFAFLFCLDSLVFRTGFYLRNLEPVSAAGLMMNYIWHEQARRPQSAGAPQVLALGDSRMAFDSVLANSLQTGCEFGSIAVPGTLPRVWYYMLREVDPDARKYAAIIIPAEDYDDEDWENFSKRQSDIQFTAMLLQPGDLLEFIRSYPDWEDRRLAASACVLRGLALRGDFQDLLVNYKRRLSHTLEERGLKAFEIYDAHWKKRNLTGLAVDWTAWRLTNPPGATEDQKRSLNDNLLRGTAPQIGYLAEYQRKWFGKIVDRYRTSPTRVIFVQLPRGPVVRPASLVVKKSSSIREFASRRGVKLAPEHLFDEIERPEWFGDATHMNNEGGARFSRILAREIARILDSGKESGR